MKRNLIIVACLLFMSMGSTGQSIFRMVCQGKLEKVDSLLQYKTINVQDDRGRTLLHWAVACQRKKIFEFLLDREINIHLADHQQKTPMHVAVQFGEEKYLDKLLSLQRDETWIKQYGPSLLEQAVLNKDTTIIKKLIVSGVDINEKNNRGSTALEIAQRMGETTTSNFLLMNGADAGMVRNFEMKGKYMGQKNPGNKPQMFAPNFISTEEQEFGSVFNADGTSFYYGVDVGGRNEIRFTQMIGDTWTKPKKILSHDRYSYNDPFLSNDESRLYFISSRALDGLGAKKDIDIWYVEKEGDHWSKPVNAGPNINSDGNEYYISFTDEGTMFFSSNGKAGEDNKSAGYDIFSARFSDGQFLDPMRLSDDINTDNYEADVFISPDESYIIFCSVRDDGFGRGDLYISFKNEDGTWEKAVNMGEEINTEHYEYCPFVTKDGKYFFYTSNQDIYWVSTEIFKRDK